MISFFALPSYVGTSYSKHQKDLIARRVSSRIRAEEMAEFLGAKLNPTGGYEHDVCIHVKPKDLCAVSDGDYVDFLDGGCFERSLRKRPLVKIIAASQHSFEYLKTIYPNEIVLIPSHHLNQERIKRERKEISVGGYIGVSSPGAFKLYAELAEKLKAVGFDFKTCFDFKTRQDAVDLYKNIDIFIYAEWVGGDGHFKIPTKMINAMSFGVPSISISPSQLMGNKEIEGYYVWAKDVDDMLVKAQAFKDEGYHKAWADKVIKFSENYHISKIAELYKNL